MGIYQSERAVSIHTIRVPGTGISRAGRGAPRVLSLSSSSAPLPCLDSAARSASQAPRCWEGGAHVPAPRAVPGGHGGLQVPSRFWTGRCADRKEGVDTHVPLDCSPGSTLTLLLCPEHSLSPPQARTSPLCRPFPADPEPPHPSTDRC